MLLQGECTQIGPTQAAKNFKYSKSRYYQIRAAFLQQGSEGILPKKAGPKRNYRRTPAVNKCVIRARFLDPDISAEVIASKLRQDGYPIATRSVERIISQYGLQKKLHIPFPSDDPKKVDTQRTKETQRREPADPRSIERAVRQLLCDKIMGNLVGIWLLIPEHLQLGTWDLLRQWTRKHTAHLEGRIAMQMVHEAALCLTGQRQKRTLSQQGFEVANGLPYLVSDSAVHELLDNHTVDEAQTIQVMLGKLRQSLGHYKGRVLSIDPHRIPSYSKRQMVRRKKDRHTPATKQLQTFFTFDADSKHPLCFTLGSSSRTVSQATPPLLEMAAEILMPKQSTPLVLADTEHYCLGLLDYVRDQLPFDLLLPMPYRKSINGEFKTIDDHKFTRHWMGYATYKRPYTPKTARCKPYSQIIQRKGERKQHYGLMHSYAHKKKRGRPICPTLSKTMALRRILQRQSSPWIAPRWHPQSSHPLCSDDYGPYCTGRYLYAQKAPSSHFYCIMGCQAFSTTLLPRT